MVRIKPFASYFPPSETFAALAESPRLLCLGGEASHRVLIATDFEEVDLATVSEAELWQAPQESPWVPEFVVLASYADYAHDGGSKSRAWRLLCGWLWDQKERKAYHFARRDVAPSSPPRSVDAQDDVRIDLIAEDNDYRERAACAIAAIREGRFYQINLLRYFKATLGRESDLLRFWGRRAGAMGAFLRVDGLDLVSFSPERLVQVESQDAGCFAKAEPIKGSAACTDDPSSRAKAREYLRTSRKERAELAIITDLLRNDLFKMASRHGVRVEEACASVSACGVEHMKAVITAECPKTLTFARLADALLPGGSITGAPKREVMTAITAYEGRSRDYFMGSLLAFGGGRLDASILIRTLTRKRNGGWEYAAGSGLTVTSDPVREEAEIAAKCTVLFP